MCNICTEQTENNMKCIISTQSSSPEKERCGIPSLGQSSQSCPQHQLSWDTASLLRLQDPMGLGRGRNKEALQVQGTPSTITFLHPYSILIGHGVSSVDHSGLQSSVWESAGPGALETEYTLYT